PEGLLHVLRLQILVLAEREMEAQHRNAELIDHVRIDVTVAIVVGNHLAASGKADGRRVVFAIVVLELLAVAAGSVDAMDPAEDAVRRRAAPAADLDVIAPREVEPLVIEPPRHVE